MLFENLVAANVKVTNYVTSSTAVSVLQCKVENWFLSEFWLQEPGHSYTVAVWRKSTGASLM